MISPQAPVIKICATKNEIATTIVDLVNSRIRHGLATSGTFHLALTGGSLGILISEMLVERWNNEPEKFAGLHLWWSDERFVPELSEERNAGPVLMGLSEDSPIHIHQVSSPDSNIEVAVAAKRYNADLFGIEMDLLLLGLGEDGHVASLFPGQWDETEERGAIEVLDSPKPPRERVSFSMSKINESGSVWFVVNGSEKHDAVEKVIARDGSVPASHVHGKVETLLFADLAALASE